MNQRMRRKISSDKMEIEAVPLTAKNNTFAKSWQKGDDVEPIEC